MKGRLAAFAALASLVAAPVALAASPPAVMTGPVTSSTESSATVGGSVNPNGQATTWLVEYGASTAYGSKTGSFSAGSGTAAVGVSTTIAGLAPGTTYHYRLVATNATGTSAGADAVLTTSGAPAPDVVTGAASEVSPTVALLAGTIDPHGRPASWWFEYGTSTSYGAKTATVGAGAPTSPLAVSAQAAGLTPGRTYHYRLVGQSDGGTTRGADHTFVLVRPPGSSTGSATAVSPTGATLNGTVAPNGVATSWHFDYGTSTSYGASTPTRSAGAGTGSKSVVETLGGLTPGTTYHYRLVASSASGTTAGADRTFTTVGTPVVSSGGPQGVGTGSATFTGAVDPKTHATTWYFEYGTTTRYGTKTPAQTLGANSGNHAISAAVGGLAPGTTYHYRLVAANSAGTSFGNDVAFTTVAIAVSATTSSYKVISGHFIRLSGAVSSGQAGVTVTLLAQRFGDTSFAAAASVLTGSGGGWTYLARPATQTTYQASWSGATSAPLTIGVRPAVTLRLLAGNRLSTHVGGASSFAGRFVQLQRLRGDRWETVKRARLSAASTAIFRPSALPRGRSTIRIAFSVNQAGPGYLGGFSRQLHFQRR